MFRVVRQRIRLVRALLGLLVVVSPAFVSTHATTAADLGKSGPGTDEQAEIADFLGLESSEFGRLRSNRALRIDERDLNVALSQLSQRPFRLLPAETPELVGRVTGKLERIIRHQVLFDEETVELFECWILWNNPAGTERPSTSASDPNGTKIRLLTRQVPELWRQGPWSVVESETSERRWVSQRPHSLGETPTETDAPSGSPTVSALIFALGHKQLLRGPAADTEPDTESVDVVPTGLTKRLEWPEDDVNVILETLRQQRESLGLAVTDDQLRRTANSWVQLGRQNFDLGLWSVLSAGQRRPLQPQENEPFYQLLRVVGAGSSLEAEALVVQDLIRHPQLGVGRAFRVQPVIKQVTHVPSQPGERGMQLGISGYYLLHGVINLPRPLRLKFDAERQIEYQQHFPVVIVTGELPAGLSVGDDVRQWVNCEGVFFKLWGYQSLRSLEAGVTQWAPLMVAQRLELSAPPSRPSTSWPIGELLLIPLGLSLLFLLVSGVRAQFFRSQR